MSDLFYLWRDKCFLQLRHVTRRLNRKTLHKTISQVSASKLISITLMDLKRYLKWIFANHMSPLIDRSDLLLPWQPAYVNVFSP